MFNQEDTNAQSKPPRSRMRLKFARLQAARNLSHLEQIKALRGIVLASGLKYRASKAGSANVPKMSFGPAISVGYESLCEYADLYLDDPVREQEVFDKLAAVKNDGFAILQVKRVPVFFPSIEACVNAASYIMEGVPAVDGEKIGRFMERGSAVFEKTKPSGEKRLIDVRPLVISVSADTGKVELLMRFEPGKNIKPEVAASMIAGEEVKPEKITRKELYWRDSKGDLEVF